MRKWGWLLFELSQKGSKFQMGHLLRTQGACHSMKLGKMKKHTGYLIFSRQYLLQILDILSLMKRTQIPHLLDLYVGSLLIEKKLSSQFMF